MAEVLKNVCLLYTFHVSLCNYMLYSKARSLPWGLCHLLFLCLFMESSELSPPAANAREECIRADLQLRFNHYLLSHFYPCRLLKYQTSFRCSRLIAAKEGRWKYWQCHWSELPFSIFWMKCWMTLIWKYSSVVYKTGSQYRCYSTRHLLWVPQYWIPFPSESLRMAVFRQVMKFRDN